jgi:uncharacterized membrane protein
MAIRKNRNEKGIRAVLYGVNPHSNGDDFSRSFFVLNMIVEAIVIRIVVIIMMINNIHVEYNISFSIMNLLIGNQLYLYTKNIATSSVN